MWLSTGLLAPGSEGRQAVTCTSPKKIPKQKLPSVLFKHQWPRILIQNKFILILKPFTEEIWKGNKSDQRKQTWCLRYMFSIYTTTFLHIYRQLILHLNACERLLHLLCSTGPSPPLWPVSSWIIPSYKYNQLSERITQQDFLFFKHNILINSTKIIQSREKNNTREITKGTIWLEMLISNKDANSTFQKTVMGRLTFQLSSTKFHFCLTYLQPPL